jgi:sugar lactone lactonase YvrE
MTDKPQVLLRGLSFPESARWHEGRFWFADWGTDEVMAVGAEGRPETMVRVPTARPETRLPQFGGVGLGPISIDWLANGRLLTVVGRDRLLLRQEPDGSLVTHADLFPIADGAWNEIVVVLSDHQSGPATPPLRR